VLHCRKTTAATHERLLRHWEPEGCVMTDVASSLHFGRIWAVSHGLACQIGSLNWGVHVDVSSRSVHRRNCISLAWLPVLRLSVARQQPRQLQVFHYAMQDLYVASWYGFRTCNPMLYPENYAIHSIGSTEVL
jgi:hypothetical protein